MSFDPASVGAAIALHGRVVRIVIAGTSGSAPRETGTWMLVWPDGQSGTIGGGALEFQAVDRARSLLQSGKPARLDRVALGPGIGQCCGGAVTLLCEVFDHDNLPAPGRSELFARAVSGSDAPPFAVTKMLAEARAQGTLPAPQYKQGWMIEPLGQATQALWIYGAGHVGRALVATLAPLPDFGITWVDTAPERFPRTPPEGVTLLPSAQPDRAAMLAPTSAHHLILTYSHALDLELCHKLLGQPCASIGLIGSKTKWARFRKRLQQLGHTDSQIGRITCPIGAPELGKHPHAIAIGVAAALLKDAAQRRNNGRMPRDSDTGHRQSLA